MDIDSIAFLIDIGEYEITEHAQKRMHQRGVSLQTTGRIIREYPGAKPLPKCLVAGYVDRRVLDFIIPSVPVYISVAVGKKVHIITVEWEPR